MKNLLLSGLILGCSCIYGQQSKDTIVYEYKPRYYNTQPCTYCPLKPGKKVPDSHPYAKYINDESLWEWRDLDLGIGKPQKVYDLKSQYKDTLKLKDGSIMEVPFWIKKEKKEKPKT